jgi:hypothetical protein
MKWYGLFDCATSPKGRAAAWREKRHRLRDVACLLKKVARRLQKVARNVAFVFFGNSRDPRDPFFRKVAEVALCRSLMS